MGMGNFASAAKLSFSQESQGIFVWYATSIAHVYIHQHVVLVQPFLVRWLHLQEILNVAIGRRMAKVTFDLFTVYSL